MLVLGAVVEEFSQKKQQMMETVLEMERLQDNATQTAVLGTVFGLIGVSGVDVPIKEANLVVLDGDKEAEIML